MSLPPGFLDELRSRLSIADVVGRKVMWDTRKSNQGKGDMWAPCPFHQEQTASFHVDDRKGFYYCFGCHAKGDAISFVRETENVSFMEAIEILAGEAGMQMPAHDPRAAERAEKRASLTEVMERAVQYFRLQLSTAAGAEARAYLARRGLSAATIERFEIGFAPPGWENLREAMLAKGVDVEQLLACGLLRSSDKGRAPYDVFRNRIMFPIRDPRGRAIAFGARAIAPEDEPKYLNSSETELFDKGRSLYNHGPAREAAGKGQPLILAEGYMDVIALGQAGFAAAVAPLGTAVTEEQLRLLWRISPEPVVALDGDQAGLKAAYRLIDLALPLLEAGQSLRFALMPEKKDPDDVIRDGGPEAMATLIEGALPMVTLLWRRETEGRVLDSPERRAALDKSLRQALGRIADPSIREHYRADIRRLRDELFGYGARAGGGGPRPGGYGSYGGGGYGGGGGRQGGRFGAPGFGDTQRGWRGPVAPLPSTIGSALAASDGQAAAVVREAVVLATFVHVPALIERHAHVLEEGRFRGPDHAELAAALLCCDPGDTPEMVREALCARLGPGPLDRLMARQVVQLTPAVRLPGDLVQAELCLVEELAKLSALDGAEEEIAEAVRDIASLEVDEDSPDGPLSWRLRAVAEARTRAGSSAEGESAEFDIAANGVRLDRGERSSFDALIASIDFQKGRRQR